MMMMMMMAMDDDDVEAGILDGILDGRFSEVGAGAWLVGVEVGMRCLARWLENEKYK